MTLLKKSLVWLLSLGFMFTVIAFVGDYPQLLGAYAVVLVLIFIGVARDGNM